MEAVLGGVVVALTLALALEAVLGRLRGPGARRVPTTPRTRAALMVAVSVVAALVVFPTLVPAARRGFFAFCGVCPIGTVATGSGPSSVGSFLRTFLLAAWYYAGTVLPVFVLACLLSGVLIARSPRLSIRGVVPSFGIAALLPVCSCGVIPIGKTMIDRGGTGVRDGLVFIAAAPLLSPIIISLGITLLGWTYLALRVLASLIVALAVAAAVRPFVAEAPRTEARHAGNPSASGVPASCVATPGPGGSALLAGWGMLAGLVRYVLFGIVLGSLFAAAVPGDYVAALLRPGFLSMAAVVVVGVPINMCAGEEILLSAPLAGMGLTMGHALAFALASTGICVSSVPLLLGVLGRKATVVMVAVYLVVPFLVGLIVNALPFLGTLGPEPF